MAHGARGKLRLQDSLRGLISHGVAYHGARGRSYLAVVESVRPVVASLHEMKIPLEEEQNLTLSHAVLQFDKDYGLEAGDNLVVTQVGEAQWHALSVHSEAKASATRTEPGVSTSVEGGVPVVSFETPWGVNGEGVPYYDLEGAAPGEGRLLVATADGNLTLVQPTGEVVAL
jgi:hypothetical protein